VVAQGSDQLAVSDARYFGQLELRFGPGSGCRLGIAVVVL
jgi:hypothetical protein